ncbi:hypothetical protein THMIRHAM_18380 [Thiomicrorhabdus immobilis]|uniref:Spermidine synthase n=1 Tax=Thiomicrorhabdus immobilis TaxID=2791037 RepID=A0ABM7MF39_9GAMM|nr:fused MFS/spermidine synthase [Thiomicrorhabdus immobilis]BCN94053.1 hypothetical protein THMIRHAM_18380 [Thiomicrorhabdus immobilis]
MKYDGMVIHSTRDEFGLIEVVDNRVTRKLHFDSPIEQSCLYLNAPMTLNFEYQEKIIERVHAFASGKKANQSIRVLMLGLGGGSMATHLFHTQPNLQITVVELRQAVIDCAYRFFQLPNEPEIETVQANAIEFIKENEHDYDVIIVDIFNAEGLPSELSDQQFQENLWQALRSPGLVVFNLWYQWDKKQPNGKPLTTSETQEVVEFWQTIENENTDCTLNRYNISSSQNLILEVVKD